MKKRELNKNKKITWIVFISIRTLVFIIMIRQIMLKEWFFAFTCFYSLIALSLPKILDKKFKIELPNALEITIYLFIFCAEILGEIGEYYLTVSWWDNLLHTTSGFVLAGVGISIIDLLNKKDTHFSLSPIYVTIASICFSMTILVFWEFFEYSSDYLFKTDMQKDTFISEISSVDLNDSTLNKAKTIKVDNLVVNGEDWKEKYGGYLDIGLNDTMIDLIDGLIGAIIFSVFGGIYLKRKENKGIASKFIPKYNFVEKQ